MTATTPSVAPPAACSRSWAGDRLLWTKVVWATFLSIFALSLYVGTGRIVEYRSQHVVIPTLYFQWERHFPFLPLMVLPYWSVDFIYFFCPLLCTSRHELFTHVKRMVFAVVFACACFLLFPLREAFDRPEVTGLAGALFRMLMTIDRPFNMAPSLHIVYVALLWIVYSRHLSGWPRRAMQAWLLLIVASTLLTFQHHFIDIITGQMLAMLCFYLFPDALPETLALERDEPNRLRNFKVARRYIAGAVACSIFALLMRPWGLLLLWPALTLGIMAGAYFRGDERVFRKIGPRLPASTWLVMFPYLLGDRVALFFYRRSGEAFSQVAPGLWIGRRLSCHEARELLAKGITSVLDLSAECGEISLLAKTNYHSLPVLDLTSPSPAQLRKAVEFIRERLPAGGVYVHCTMGFSRSAAVAVAYLLAEGRAADVERAIENVKAVRPHVRLKAHARAALAEFATGWGCAGTPVGSALADAEIK